MHPVAVDQAAPLPCPAAKFPRAANPPLACPRPPQGLPGDAVLPELAAAEPCKPDSVSLFWKARRLHALVFQVGG